MSEKLPQCRHWRIDLDADGILWLFLNREGEAINSLSEEVLREFDSLLDYAKTKVTKGLAILSDKSTGFILGADIREFGKFTDVDEVTKSIEEVHAMFRKPTLT